MWSRKNILRFEKQKFSKINSKEIHRIDSLGPTKIKSNKKEKLKKITIK